MKLEARRKQCINYVVVLRREEKGSSEKVDEKKERNWLVFITSVVAKRKEAKFEFNNTNQRA